MIRKKVTWTILIITALIILIDSLLFEKLFFKVKKFRIGNMTGTPIRIIHLTDLHLKKSLGLRHKNLAVKINNLHPDLLFVSGDSTDRHGNCHILEKFLKLIDKEIQKVTIMGNHDYDSGLNTEEVRAIYEEFNGDLLVNETKDYEIKGKIITITGIDDYSEGEGDFPEAVRKTGKKDNHFVLIHNPKQQE